ncbi:hypothetical protein [Dongia sp.]|uniref:hypothetical protein n=1 Tax=Dongia sp. TaxID=1977262 RepID=UPI0035AFAFBA
MKIGLSCLSALLLVAVAACSTPVPPRPAMQALSAAGNFGFSDRDVDPDTVEVTYRGAEVKVSARNPRADSRVVAEKEKVRDLALLHAARLAQERGAPAFRIVSEKTDSDIDVQSYPRCRPAPFWGPGFGYYGYRHGFGYGWPYYDYTCSENRSASTRAVSVIVIDLVAKPVSGDQSVSTAETITRLEKIYAGATYQ